LAAASVSVAVDSAAAAAATAAAARPLGMAAPLALALALALALPAARGDDQAPKPGAAKGVDEAVRDSVVKITVSVRSPDTMHPWTKQSPREASGTGVVIEGKRILTNAHVVTYASQISVESSQSSDKVAATVEAISPGMDLAVLKLDDESFFDARPPLPRVHELPSVKDAVLVYGYPQGGSSQSVTKGIVSRIEFAPYGDHASGVRVQIDAAINPGNSGGPALVDGKVVGLIFSRLNQSDNIGYIIPGEEIDLFLDDVKDGRYDGKPAMFDRLQTLENDALRAFLKVDKKTTGMVVHSPEGDGPDYPLKPWDLITRIGDHEVDNTGMVKAKGDLRLRFQYYVQKLAHDGKVPITVVRDRKELKIDLPVSPRHDMLVESLRGKYPSYFVYGPLVFAPVTTEFLAHFGGGAIHSVLSLIGSPLATRRGDRPAFPGEQLVVVTSPMFPHKIAKGYDNPFSKVVKEVNGVKVKNLRHMVELLRDTKETFTRISFDDKASETIVFNHKEALDATEEVLNDNGIRQRASDDLTAVWNAKPGDKDGKDKEKDKD
jgi:S1-C subfamily serine protease